MNKKLWTAAAVLGFAVSGCSGDVSGDGGGLVGTWEGYVEAYAFNSGSDRLEFTINAVDQATGAVTGTVRLGQGAAPAPATDPDIGYPAGFDYQNDQDGTFEGFSYTLLNATIIGARFQADFDTHELWTGWCALQTSYAYDVNVPDGGYSCVRNWGYGGDEMGCYQPDPMSGQNVPVDCGKLYLCQSGRQVCRCDASGCSVETQPRVTFDVALDGDIADGTVDGLKKRMNVRIERNK